MLKIGITGGMGSGKTTASQVFRSLGIPVYNSDERARFFMETEQTVRNDVINLLGNSAYMHDRLNREYIANRVFNDNHLLNHLNGIIHPIVANDAKEWESNQINVPFTLREAALLYESGGYLTLDAVILVKAPLELRIYRIMNRDRVTRDQIVKRLRFQWPDKMKEQLSDYTVLNDGKRMLIPQLVSLYKQLLLENSELLQYQ